MKKNFILALMGILMGTIFSLAQSAEKDEIKLGEKLYNDKCHICHGKVGDGNGSGSIAFSPRPANFTDPKFWQKNDDKKITDVIKNGYKMMPAFDLNSDQIKAVIDYLKQAFKK